MINENKRTFYKKINALINYYLYYTSYNFRKMEDKTVDEKIEQILYISFNQDGSCFCLGTTKGYKIYNTLPLQELHNSGKKD